MQTSSAAPADIKNMSLASIVKSMTPQQQREMLFKTGLVDTSKLGKRTLKEIEKDVELGFLEFLDPAEKAVLRYSWRFWARPNQLVDMEDSSWTTWLALCGRGWGKTRMLSEWIRERVEAEGDIRIALIGPTAASTRDVIVRGKSGLVSCCPPWMKAEYSPSNSRVTWSNGAIAQLFSAEEPERLRGPEFNYIACDELCAWKNAELTWNMAQMCLRLGTKPRTIIATTPKPTPLLKRILGEKTTRRVGGSTYENKDNLAGTFINTIIQQYEGTDLGRQELHAELLLENKNALWSRDVLAGCRQPNEQRLGIEDLVQVVVAVDPPASSSETSDECGIVVCGMTADRKGVVLADLSDRMTPKRWAQVALKAAKDYSADRIVAERNNGGEMVRHTIRSFREGGLDGSKVPVKTVFASRGKWTRAEPVAALFQQRRVIMNGIFPKLEDQLCEYDPFEGQKSPDRFDAMVWGLSDIMLKGGSRFFI